MGVYKRFYLEKINQRRIGREKQGRELEAWILKMRRKKCGDIVVAPDIAMALKLILIMKKKKKTDVWYIVLLRENVLFK